MNAYKTIALAGTVALLAGCGAHAQGMGHHRGGGIMRAVQRLDLTPAQKSKIDKIASGYRAAHPQGSARDPQAMRAERQEIMNVLTPAQRSQLQQERKSQGGS